MTWNVFENAARDDGRPGSSPLNPKRYTTEIEYRRGLENHHEMPTNDGFDHIPSRECACQPVLQDNDMKANGVFVFQFEHQFQGDSK